MIELLVELEVYRSDSGVVRRNRTRIPRWAWLRANRGSFDVEHDGTGIEIVANGRGSWIGWLELATEPVDEIATRMTAQVIADVGADILAVVEAEDRPSLDRFNDELLAGRYGHGMLIDGNDTRGIDVGIMTTRGSRSAHAQQRRRRRPGAAGEHLFSRDCAEYRCRLPSGATVWVLVNHFKSQSGGGGDPNGPAKPRASATIVDALVAAGDSHIVVMGDLNEGPAAGTSRPPTWPPCSSPTARSSTSTRCPSFDAGPAARHLPELRAAQPPRLHPASPTPWPRWSSAAASNAAGCGAPRPTSTRRPHGTSTPRSRAPHTPPPTTPPSTSTSTSDPSSPRGRRPVPTKPHVPRARSTLRTGRTRGVSGQRRPSDGPPPQQIGHLLRQHRGRWIHSAQGLRQSTSRCL